MRTIKGLLVLWGLCLVCPAVAQPVGKAIKTAVSAGERVSKQARSVVKETVQYARLSKVPSMRSFSLPAAAVERHIFRPVKLTPFRELQFNFDEAPYSWMLEKGREYETVMTEFKDFKKEMDIFLYYQSKSSERRVLHQEEIAYWRTRIDEMDSRLMDLCWNVNADDPAISQALEYMTYAKWSVYPHAKDIYFAKPLPARTDRTFAEDEFFLRDPAPLPSKRWEFASSRARRVAKELPAGLRVAVVNDIVYFRDHLETLNRKGLLFPDGNLSVFSNAEELLSSVRESGQKFDVVFTDIIIAGNGGGGYYLASELRGQGYDGVIIALASYEEDVELGRQMFERGFDGMITMSGGVLYKRDWPANMMQKMVNYFYYRNLNGWNH